MRNTISRALGITTLSWFDEYIETAEFTLSPNSQWLLCSDGVYDMIDSEEIKRILEKHATPEESVREIIAKANECGGKDNITAIVINAK